MNDFELRLLVDNDFDTVNRVLNKFCGKGFSMKNLEVRKAFSHNLSELRIHLYGDRKVLEVISRKLLNYVDVHRLLNLSEMKQLEVV